MVGVRVSKGKLGHTFSEATFKMQVPAEQLMFDLVNSLGLRPVARLYGLCTGPGLSLPQTGLPYTLLLGARWPWTLGPRSRKAHRTLAASMSENSATERPYLQGFLLSGLPSRTPDGTVTQCPLGLRQFYLRCNLLNTENRRPEYLLWATLLLSLYTVWCKRCSQRGHFDFLDFFFIREPQLHAETVRGIKDTILNATETGFTGVRWFCCDMKEEKAASVWLSVYAGPSFSTIAVEVIFQIWSPTITVITISTSTTTVVPPPHGTIHTACSTVIDAFQKQLQALPTVWQGRHY